MKMLFLILSAKSSTLFSYSFILKKYANGLGDELIDFTEI